MFLKPTENSDVLNIIKTYKMKQISGYDEITV